MPRFGLSLGVLAALFLESLVHAQALPKPVVLTQAKKGRAHPKLKLPKGHDAGPVIPGLSQGAVPQGLAYWKAQNWFLLSCYFPSEDPSVVVALDARSGAMVRCLTLVGAGGKAHAGHVGGLAVSDKYLWVGSGQVHRAALAELLAAPASPALGHLRLEKLFQAECKASFVACHERVLWVGEFVAMKDPKYKGDPDHHVQGRTDNDTYAWAAAYELDGADNVKATGKVPLPDAILGIRQHVQGMAFLPGRIILSTSHGRDNDSILAIYANPMGAKPHRLVKAGSAKVPFWFLDGKNKVKQIDFPPMVEGITAYGNRLAAISESGAKIYQKGGRGPLDNVIVVDP
jgi:hypothetical protein